MMRMAHQLRTAEGKALYSRRKSTVETVFGIVKDVMGFRHFDEILGLARETSAFGLCGYCGGFCCAGVIMRPKTTPISNNSHMGIASSDCETISGGVSNMPSTKHPTRM